MGSGNNTTIIDACIQEFKESNELKKAGGELFELFVGVQATKEQGISAEEIEAAVVDGSGDGGIDIFLPLIDEQPILTMEDVADISPTKQSVLTLFVAQSKHETSFKESVLDKWITSMDSILDLNVPEGELAYRFNPSLVEKILAFRKVLIAVSVKGGSISVRYVYATRSNEYDPTLAFASKVSQLSQNTKKLLASAEVAVQCLSAGDLFKLYREDAPERRSISFAGNPLAVQYKDGIGYVGLVSLSGLREFISSDSGQVDERVFESNVRHFQGSVDVNSKIKHTIKSDQDRDFWWLNNGVTIVSPAATSLGSTLSISNPQIVNGLQTSFSIHEALENDSADARCVLVKVIVSSDKATVDKVISATNSQTAVGAASLRATDEVQRQIETFFESKGYFYDRRKNYYRNRGKPIGKIFGITNVAQAIHAVINRSPASARARPTSLIKEEHTYQNIFDANRDFQAYLTCCLVVQGARAHVSTITDDAMRTTLSNYVYHLAQVGTAFALEDAHYTAKGVATLAYGKVVAVLPLAAEWLGSFVTNYVNSYPSSNVITLSKSTPFSEAINAALHARVHAS